MIEQILSWLDTKYIDFMMFWLVIAAGFFQDKYLAHWTLYKKDARYNATLRTFVVSIVLCGLYTWLVKYEAGLAPVGEQKEGLPLVKIFISFALATSFYDIVLRLFKIEGAKRGLQFENDKTSTMFEQSIYDTVNDKWLQNDVSGTSSPLPIWGAGNTSFIYTSRASLDAALANLGGAPGQFIGQNAPPR